MTSEIDFEGIAKALHAGWMQFKAAEGVVFGLNRTATTHPHLVAWDQLDDQSRNQDRFIAAILLKEWSRGLLAPADIPAAIHNAWMEWSVLQAENHPHARPYREVHVTNPGEHAIQADRITPLLLEAVNRNRTPFSDRTCLALLPFRPHTLQVYDQVLENAILEAGYSPVRADRLRSSQAIHEDVIDQIELCSAVVADLTDDNANVNYEIGIARSLGKPIIMISEERNPDSVPFYYKGQRIHFFNRTTQTWKVHLKDHVKSSLTGAVRTDPLSENQRLGLTGFFRSDDNAFEAELKRQIKLTRARFVAVGWGLAFLNRQRREVMDALRNQVLSEPKLTVHIILARPDHPGLLERINEEQRFQRDNGLLADWQHEFFKFACELPLSLQGSARERVFVRRVSYLPTAMVVRLDDTYYFRCYGPPNSGGWQSPWLRCQRSLASDIWTGFLDNLTNQAVQCSFRPDSELEGTPPI